MEMQPGDRVRQLREMKHYTRNVLAEKVGITPKFLYEIERGKRSFSAYNLCRLSEALSVSCDYIMYGEDRTKQDTAEFALLLENLEPNRLRRIKELLQVMDMLCDLEAEKASEKA